MKPIGYMRADLVGNLAPQDCFYGFVEKAKGAEMPIYTIDQVKDILNDLPLEWQDREGALGDLYLGAGL